MEIIAERRMFAKSIIGSARFLRMPPSSRLLYYDLGMYADDDGVVEAFTVMRQTNATEDDLRVLIAKGFVRILNEDLVAVITDWSVNNFIRTDRYKPSIYKELLVGIPDDNQRYTNGRPSIGKDRLGKDRSGEDKDSIKDTIHSSSEELKEIIDAWNKLPVTHIHSINGGTKRYKMVKARLAEYGINAVLEAINLVSQSPFLLGRKTDFVITFDWFIKPNNFIKVYEGNYSNREKHDAMSDFLKGDADDKTGFW